MGTDTCISDGRSWTPPFELASESESGFRDSAISALHLSGGCDEASIGGLPNTWGFVTLCMQTLDQAPWPRHLLRICVGHSATLHFRCLKSAQPLLIS